MYKYKYNGKELQEELGLNTYTYGWREYDPAIGKFNRLNELRAKGKFDKESSEEAVFLAMNNNVTSEIYNIEAALSELKEIEESDDVLVDFYESYNSFAPVGGAVGDVKYDND